jgi:hypothetical protein
VKIQHFAGEVDYVYEFGVDADVDVEFGGFYHCADCLDN